MNDFAREYLHWLLVRVASITSLVTALVVALW